MYLLLGTSIRLVSMTANSSSGIDMLTPLDFNNTNYIEIMEFNGVVFRITIGLNGLTRRLV